MSSKVWNLNRTEYFLLRCQQTYVLWLVILRNGDTANIWLFLWFLRFFQNEEVRASLFFMKMVLVSKKLGNLWHRSGVYNLLLLPAALLLFIWSTAANSHNAHLRLWLPLTAKCQLLTQNTFKHKLRIDSITLCDITIQLVTHRVDWFSCLAFVLLQYMPARPPNLIF